MLSYHESIDKTINYSYFIFYRFFCRALDDVFKKCRSKNQSLPHTTNSQIPQVYFRVSNQLGNPEILMDSSDTPLKFNMKLENNPLEKEIPFGNHSFQVPF